MTRTVDDVLREHEPGDVLQPDNAVGVLTVLLALRAERDTQAAEIDALRAAVRPFAEAAKMLEGDETSDTKVWELSTPFNITCGHLLEAAAVIALAREAGH